jgi:hypothetical protein
MRRLDGGGGGGVAPELIPTPAPGFVMVIQVSAVDAPQVHWVPAVTLSVRLVLNASIAKLVGDTE